MQFAQAQCGVGVLRAVDQVLVLREQRGRGTGSLLLARAEQAAARLGRRLLSLETAPSGGGERLLLAAGWREAGRIPGLALDATGEGIEAVRFIRG